MVQMNEKTQKQKGKNRNKNNNLWNGTKSLCTQTIFKLLLQPKFLDTKNFVYI